MKAISKTMVALSCAMITIGGLTACTPSEKRDTIQEWVKKDIIQYYDYGVALSEPQEITYSADFEAEDGVLSEHNAKEVVIYKTTAFQFSYEDIVDEWLSVVWVKADKSPSSRYAQADLEISSVNYSRMRV